MRAKELLAEPSLYPFSHTKGYMQVMKELLDVAGYANLKLTSQNLWDQAASSGKTLGNVGETSVSVWMIGDREKHGADCDITESEDSNNEARLT